MIHEWTEKLSDEFIWRFFLEISDDVLAKLQSYRRMKKKDDTRSRMLGYSHTATTGRKTFICFLFSCQYSLRKEQEKKCSCLWFLSMQLFVHAFWYQNRNKILNKNIRSNIISYIIDGFEIADWTCFSIYMHDYLKVWSIPNNILIYLKMSVIKCA